MEGLNVCGRAPSTSKVLTHMSRSIMSTELDLALTCTQVDPTSFVDAARYLRDTEAGSYRPEWTWVH